MICPAMDAQKLGVTGYSALQQVWELRASPGGLPRRPSAKSFGPSRSFLQLVAETLRRLSPEKRRESIALLNPEQRLALEKHMMAAPLSKQATVEAQRPKRRSTFECDASKRSRKGTASRPGKVMRKSQVAASPKRRAKLAPKGLSQKCVRGLSYFFASVGCESLIFHCRPVRKRTIALADLETLQRLKSLCAACSGSFEERLAAAVDALRADYGLRCLSEIKVFVRSATQHWLGRDLHTPSWPLSQLEAVLDARRRLQAARGNVMIGGCGLLYQCSIAEAAELWARIRRAYLEVCAAVPGCQVSRRAETLDRAEAAFATHRRRMQELAESRQLRRSEQLQRKERAVQRCQQREAARAQKAANRVQVHDQRALRSLERLLERWSRMDRARGG